MIKYATIELNSCCNQSCVWCYNITKWHDLHHISEDLFDVVLFNLLTVGCKQLLLTGGEPTIHPLLPKLMKKAFDAGIQKIYVVTNGYRIHEDFFKLLRDYRSNVIINVSIHGSDKHIHDKLTQIPGSFDGLILSIKEYRKQGYIVNAQTTLCRSNHNDILKILSVLENNKIDNVLINCCMKPIGKEVSSDEFLSITEYCECIYRAIKNYAGSVNVEIGPNIPFCLMPANFHEIIVQKRISINYGCGFNGNELIFNLEGNILLCMHLPDVFIGNVKDVDDMSSFVQKMKNKLDNTRRYPMEKCAVCENMNNCYGGGCPIIWLTNKPIIH